MNCQRRPVIFFTVAVTIVLLFLVHNCKDLKGTHFAAKLSKCNHHLNDSEWDDAIEACSELETDDGYHKTAQAYMGRSGVSLFSLAIQLSEAPTDATKLIFEKIPNTEEKRSDYATALRLIMESFKLQTNTMYLESLLISSMLIMKEVKDMFDLQLNEGAFRTCAGILGSNDISSCSFAPVIESGKLNFSGLGTKLYENICGISDSTTDTTTEDPSGITRNVTIHGCTVKTDSVLAYNKIAAEEYEKVSIEKIVDAVKKLHFYSKMDTGNNFSGSINSYGSIYLCKDTGHMKLIPEKPVAGDRKLNDCEMLSYFKNLDI